MIFGSCYIDEKLKLSHFNSLEYQPKQDSTNFLLASYMMNICNLFIMEKFNNDCCGNFKDFGNQIV
jgi:hypothetical protein